MKITIDTEILKSYNLTLEEFYLLLFHCTGKDYITVSNRLIQKNLVSSSVFKNTDFIPPDSTKQLVEKIIIDSNKKVQNTKSELEDIAEALRNLYPQGKKPGTTYMWRDSVAIITKKLQSLIVQFDYHFTKEQAIKATETYIKSFNGDYTYMQLLKYFILKKNIKTGELQSDFMSYIENENEDIDIDHNWTVQLK